MNKGIQKILLFGMLISSTSIFSQIKEEKLILDRKREPEVKKIEKKKTSVTTVKNYPPQSKKVEDSLHLKYQITNVPASSDFKTSTIQGEDISPKFDADYQRNYFQLGMGNYGKILADGNVSTKFQEDAEVGVDLHFLSTKGLTKVYDWSSKQNSAKLGAYLNFFSEKGKLNLDANYNAEDYNYYGIYALKPAADIDVKQKTNRFNFNAYYDFYSNEIFNDVRVKSSFLGDHFDAKETAAEILANFSKHDISFNDYKINADLGTILATQQSSFSLLNKNTSNSLALTVSPKITFFSGNSYLMLGSDFAVLNQKNTASNITSEEKSNTFHWFPRAEIMISATEMFKFYGGVDGGLQLNSYADFLQENPYLVSDQYLKPTETQLHFYVGLKGDVDQMWKYDVMAGFSKKKNISYYKANSVFDNIATLNRSAYNYANTFSVFYDDGTVSEVDGNVHYFPLENLSIDAGLKYQQFKFKNVEHVYYKPLVTADIGANYNMLNKKLNVGFKAFFVTDRTTNLFEISDSPVFVNPPLFMISEKTDEKVGGYADLNISAEYKIHKNFSIFAHGNNLLNTQYQTYNGYKVLGAQVLGGVRISF